MVAGIGIHVALDLHHQRRMAAARAAALARDHYSCRGCGGRAPHVGTHLWRQPVLLPSYRSENLVSLCPACHERAHRDRDGAEAWS
jgi:predicted HNH restriction endonuclease